MATLIMGTDNEPTFIIKIDGFVKSPSAAFDKNSLWGGTYQKGSCVSRNFSTRCNHSVTGGYGL